MLQVARSPNGIHWSCTGFRRREVGVPRYQKPDLASLDVFVSLAVFLTESRERLRFSEKLLYKQPLSACSTLFTCFANQRICLARCFFCIVTSFPWNLRWDLRTFSVEHRCTERILSLRRMFSSFLEFCGTNWCSFNFGLFSCLFRRLVSEYGEMSHIFLNRKRSSSTS